MSKGLKQILDELHRNLLTVYGDRLDRLVLYGSCARGEQRADSDIDVLVVLRGKINLGEEIRLTVPITADFSLRYQVFISFVFVTSEQYIHDEEPLLVNIRSEGIAI